MIPTCAILPTIVRQANRMNRNEHEAYVARVRAEIDHQLDLAAIREARRETRNCLIAVGVFLLLAGIAVFGPSLVY